MSPQPNPISHHLLTPVDTDWLELVLPRKGDDLDEHVVRRSRRGCVLRGPRLGADVVEVDQVRLVASNDRVDRVVDPPSTIAIPRD
jgi:hypothetical protein